MATRNDGYGTIHRHAMYDLLAQVTEITAGKSHHGANSKPDHRGQNLLLKEILNPSINHDYFTEDDFLKYSTIWIRRNYESNYNMSVVNVTSPAQHFHVLRRQIHRPFVKPLILLTSKWLHHHTFCKSNLHEMGPGTWFRRLITEKSRANNMATQQGGRKKFPLADHVNKIIFCSGKIYYELYHARTRKMKHASTALERTTASQISLVRLEQLAPFPMDRVAFAVNNHPTADVVWCQEEPKNQGAWSFVQPRFKTALAYFYRGRPYMNDVPAVLQYVGRPVSATTAGGSFSEHVKEQRDLIERALE